MLASWLWEDIATILEGGMPKRCLNASELK